MIHIIAGIVCAVFIVFATYALKCASKLKEEEREKNAWLLWVEAQKVEAQKARVESVDSEETFVVGSVKGNVSLKPGKIVSGDQV